MEDNFNDLSGMLPDAERPAAEASAPKPRVNFLSVAENASLKLASEPIYRAFPNCLGVFHVGSSTWRRDYRDVDVRCIIGDDEFERLFGAGRKSPACLDLWFLFCWAVSEWMQKRTGMNVDFQVQSMTMAAEYRGQTRNGLFFANSPD